MTASTTPPEDRMEARRYGALFQTLLRTAASRPDRPACCVPPMAGRAYHPEGREIDWKGTLAAVPAQKQRYERAGYGLGHRVAVLFDRRPEFFRAPGWRPFVHRLPTGTSAEVQKIHIFPPGTDPRREPGAIDLRGLKKQHKS